MNFQLQYQDRLWSDTHGYLNECPKICRDYKDNQQTCHLRPGSDSKPHDPIHASNTHPGSPPHLSGETNTIPNHLNHKLSRGHGRNIRDQHPAFASFKMPRMQNNLPATNPARPQGPDAHRDINHGIRNIFHMGTNLPPGPGKRLDSPSLQGTITHHAGNGTNPKRSLGHTRQG